VDLYTLQEFLGVLVAVAVLVGTILVLGSAFILVQELISRAIRLAKAGVKVFERLSVRKTMSLKSRWSIRSLP